MPETWLTPQLAKVSTIASLTVRLRSASGLTPTRMPSSRTSTEQVGTASSYPAGDLLARGQHSGPCQGHRSQPFSMDSSPSGPPSCGQRLSSAPYWPSWCVRQMERLPARPS